MYNVQPQYTIINWYMYMYYNYSSAHNFYSTVKINILKLNFYITNPLLNIIQCYCDMPHSITLSSNLGKVPKINSYLFGHKLRIIFLKISGHDKLTTHR